MITRRAFLRAAAGAAAWPALGRRAADSAPVKARPDVVVYDGKYPGWPWVVAGAGGILYCVFREGTVHDYSPDGRGLLCTSRDGGRTWSRPAVIIDAPEVDDRNLAVVELPNRELLVSYNTYSRARESRAMTIRSADGGTTWAEPRPVGEPNSRTKAAALVLSKDRLLLPYYIAPGSGALAGLSADNGKTWRAARLPDADGFVGDEWDALELEPGRIIGILRNNHPKGDGTFWRTESKDGGTTWAVPRRTNVRSRRFASPAHFFRQGKTPTLIYADRRMVSVSAVRTRDPEFLRWDVENRLPCYRYNADESPIADGSYPVSAPVGPRRRLIVDYEVRDGARRITGYFVNFPEDW
jgi:hypothetical protein